MREAVIVSTARTPLTKAHRGEFNITPGPTLAAFAVRAAVDRAGIVTGEGTWVAGAIGCPQSVRGPARQGSGGSPAAIRSPGRQSRRV